LPPVAATGDVTVRVAEAEAPGESESEAEDSVPVQPEGKVPVRSKVEAVQALLSLFVTESVNGTAVPATTAALCEGERLTVVPVRPYEPPVAATGDVTVRVAAEEPPGESESDVEDSVPVQPDGTVSVRSKVDAAQELLSLFVTESVNGTAVPAATAALCKGEKTTVGFARVHGIATTSVAEAVAR
jgi:hypothetical protein